MGRVLISIVAAGCTAWAFGALDFDAPFLKRPLAITWLIAALAMVIFIRGFWRKIGAVMLGFLLVCGWWLTLKPSNDRQWQPDVAQTPWAEVNGDTVTFHNVRNCEYRTESDYTPHWETRSMHLSAITGVDIALGYWGSEWMAHPIVSFRFSDAPPICFSVETRKEVGESYSAIGGIYRQFELVYIVADERDPIRVRTNYRPGEDVYLYKTTATPEMARERFMEYVTAMNALHEKPKWYNAITTNCTTGIRAQRAASDRSAFDWRMLVNGKLDELMYERGVVDRSMPFAELKKSVHINSRAKAANDSPDFSKRIRE